MAATAPANTPEPPASFYGGENRPKTISKTTPTKRSARTTGQYTTNHNEHEPAFVGAAKEMEKRYAEWKIPQFMAWLDDGPPMPEPNYGALKEIASKPEEKDMYDPFIKEMQHFLCSGWLLVNSSSHSDPNIIPVYGLSQIKPDVTLYAQPREATDPVTQASKAECFGEFKISAIDEPFRMESVDNSADPVFRDHKDNPFERAPASARDTRGQLALYINAIQASQQRTHVFSFYIRKNLCRLLHHTRVGTAVTPLFDYTVEPYLHQFFWRLSHMPRSRRGYDDSMELVSHQKEMVNQLTKIREMLGLSLEDPVYRIKVQDLTLYVSTPFTRSHIYVVGRGTRCFYAYEPTKDRTVLLKDTWRPNRYKPEHEYYEILHQHQVPNIPQVLSHGDVPNTNDTQITPTIANHCLVHYRLVLDVVGEPLDTFGSTHELVQCIADAFEAHRCAWTNARLLHRDISFGNIIIVKGRGMLIDWERAKEENDNSERALERTGTWQFMSLRLLEQSSPVRHEVRDDIESFVYVLLWVAARYAPNKMTPTTRAGFLDNFDYQPGDLPIMKKRSLVMQGNKAAITINLNSSFLQRLLGRLVKQLAYLIDVERTWEKSKRDDAETRLESKEDPAARKRIMSNLQEEIQEISSQVSAMETHEWMDKMLKTALKNQEWKEEYDCAVNHDIADLYASTRIQGKRKKEMMSDYQSDSGKRLRIFGQ